VCAAFLHMSYSLCIISNVEFELSSSIWWLVSNRQVKQQYITNGGEGGESAEGECVVKTKNKCMKPGKEWETMHTPRSTGWQNTQAGKWMLSAELVVPQLLGCTPCLQVSWGGRKSQGGWPDSLTNSTSNNCFFLFCVQA